MSREVRGPEADYVLHDDMGVATPPRTVQQRLAALRQADAERIANLEEDNRYLRERVGELEGQIQREYDRECWNCGAKRPVVAYANADTEKKES